MRNLLGSHLRVGISFGSLSAMSADLPHPKRLAVGRADATPQPLVVLSASARKACIETRSAGVAPTVGQRLVYLLLSIFCGISSALYLHDFYCTGAQLAAASHGVCNTHTQNSPHVCTSAPLHLCDTALVHRRPSAPVRYCIPHLCQTAFSFGIEAVAVRLVNASLREGRDNHMQREGQGPSASPTNVAGVLR